MTDVFEGQGLEPSVVLWRIEQLKPVPAAADGKLHTGAPCSHCVNHACLIYVANCGANLRAH
jgi:hypothetical protein